MRRLAISFIALVLILSPVAAFAETVEWDAAESVGMPKGVAGYGGIRCHGEATQDGNTYKYTNYVGADGDEPVESERRWQVNFCRHILEEDMSRGFLYYWGIELDVSRIKMTITRL